MSIKERIGLDLNQRMALEPGIDLAIKEKIRFLNICLDPEPELLDPKNPRLADARKKLADNGITLGLHTLSAMNTAEGSPFLARAADAYLAAYLQAARAIGAPWVIMHGGYHFTADKQMRMELAVERLERASKIAQSEGVNIHLENMNPEPAGAEVKYLVHDVEEAKFYFKNLTSRSVRWVFTTNHAHMLPYGIAGFVEQMEQAGVGVDRIGEVRLADNRGEIEEHLYPGTGNLDFGAMFKLLESRGYRGHYMQDYMTVPDMVRGRHIVADLADAALAKVGT